MSIKKTIVLACTLAVAVFFLAACAGAPGATGPAGPAGPVGPAGPAGPAGLSPKAADLSCTECHNSGTLLTGKLYAWEASKHGSGVVWEEERGIQTCAGCHSGASFIDRIAANQTFADYGSAKDVVLPDATPQDCRTCHTIHTTYTKDDFALRTEAPVAMVTSGQTFDKGAANLCVQCHQARRYMADFPAKDASGNAIPGSYAVTIRFNPHLSPQSDMLLGVGGGGTVTGSPAGHYTMTEEACVSCHMGGPEKADHFFKPQVSTCVACHADAKDFDINGTRTKIEEKYNALKDELTKAGLLDAEGSPVPGTYEEAKAFPLWVFGYITEDGSMGIHNPKYATALLDAALDGLK